MTTFLIEPMVLGIPTDLLILLGVLFVGVLISDLIGNMVAFDNRLVNSLVTATIATLIVFGMSYVLYASGGSFDDPSTFVAVFVGVFVADTIGNLITFGNRFTNALTTAFVSVILVFVVLFVVFPQLFTQNV